MTESSKFSGPLAALRSPKNAIAESTNPEEPEDKIHYKEGIVAPPVKLTRPLGKRSQPGYSTTSVIIRKATRTAVQRRLLDDVKGRDFSELVEELLATWLVTKDE